MKTGKKNDAVLNMLLKTLNGKDGGGEDFDHVRKDHGEALQRASKE